MKNQQEQQEGVDSLVSPSFSSYTSDKLTDIANRVDRDYFRSLEPQDDVDGNGFEFVTFRKDAGGVFFDGYAGPVFPIFNRDLLTVYESDDGELHGRGSSAEDDVMVPQLPIRKLLVHNEDRRCDPNPLGTYCVWTPNSAQASPARHNKSNSAGSSLLKRWKLLDLLWRSNSDGKDSVVLLTPSSSNLVKKKDVKGENSKEEWSSTKVTERHKLKRQAAAGAGGKKMVSAHEALYMRNRELRKVDKRRSYLPYRQDLIGFSSF